jgi:hypothetical protein
MCCERNSPNRAPLRSVRRTTDWLKVSTELAIRLIKARFVTTESSTVAAYTLW